jgi:hypothetical protein
VIDLVDTNATPTPASVAPGAGPGPVAADPGDDRGAANARKPVKRRMVLKKRKDGDATAAAAEPVFPVSAQ